MYRPGQPNWENTMWKFQDFSATQILREIDFGHFEAPKPSILINRAAINFGFLGIFGVFKGKMFLKSKFKAYTMTVFDILNSAKTISRKIKMAGKLLNFHSVEFPVKNPIYDAQVCRHFSIIKMFLT